MKNGARKPDGGVLKARIADLEKALAEQTAKADNNFKQWMGAQTQASASMAAQTDNRKLKHQLEVIQHIVDGKPTDAIQSLLSPDVFIFNLDIRMDQATHDHMVAEIRDGALAAFKAKVAEISLAKEAKTE